MFGYFAIVNIAINSLYYKYIVYMNDTISTVILVHVINLMLTTFTSVSEKEGNIISNIFLENVWCEYDYMFVYLFTLHRT